MDLPILCASRNTKAYFDWIPTFTLGIAPSITLSDLGNSSIAHEMLLGIERRVFLQGNNGRTNARMHKCRAYPRCFLGTEIRVAVSRWGLD